MKHSCDGRLLALSGDGLSASVRALLLPAHPSVSATRHAGSLSLPVQAGSARLARVSLMGPGYQPGLDQRAARGCPSISDFLPNVKASLFMAEGWLPPEALFWRRR